jgi:methylene-tetrahydromethanopterin dehydrogenase
MIKPRILHFLTPLANVSPFDVNMAVDAGFVVADYTNLLLKDVVGLTQDAMFSRSPHDAPKTCLFVGGRDALLALDMAEAAKVAMFPPFVISVFADPSGAFTTAASMIACVVHQLSLQGARIIGAKVAVFGAKGVVGGMAGVIAAEAGADVILVAHDDSSALAAKAKVFQKRFNLHFTVAEGITAAQKRAITRNCDVVLTAGPPGVQVLSREDLEHAGRLKVAADVNAVPPLGIEGVDAKANGVRLGFAPGVGIGALAIGDVKFRTQHALLQRIFEAENAQFFTHSEAYRIAIDLLR